MQCLTNKALGSLATFFAFWVLVSFFRPDARGSHFRGRTPVLVKAHPEEILLLAELMSNSSSYLEYTTAGASPLAALFVQGNIYTVTGLPHICNSTLADPLFESLAAAGRFEIVCGAKSDVDQPETMSLRGGMADLILIDGSQKNAAAVFATRYMNEDSLIVYRDWSEHARQKLSDFFDIALPFSKGLAGEDTKEFAPRRDAGVAKDAVVSGRQVKLFKNNGSPVIVSSSYGSGSATTALLRPKRVFFRRARNSSGMVADFREYITKR